MAALEVVQVQAQVLELEPARAQEQVGDTFTDLS